MKNFIYIILLGVIFTQGCDPLDDVYDELDKTASDGVSKELSITLTEDDYALLEDEGVALFGNFESVEEAQTYIPTILESLYPQLGNGSSILVTYDLYAPVRINDEISYTLTEEDYSALGETFGTLGNDSDVINAAKYLYPDASQYDLVALTYEYYNGSGNETRTSKVAFVDGFWYIAYEPTSEDYRFMGQSFDNFDSRSLARERIAVLFDRLFPFAEEGDLRTSVFTYTYKDNNGTPDDTSDDFRVYEDFLAVFEFNGENWIPQQDATPQMLQFGNEDGIWIPDNTVRYTLSTADYTAIASNEDLGTSGARSNLASFGNFSPSSGWTDEYIIEAIAYVLKTNFPDSETGQKYLVNYDTYPAGLQTALVILNEAGDYEVID